MIYTNAKQTYGLALAKLRLFRGRSRQDVVNHNDISLNSLASIENGQALINLENLGMLLDYYGISAQEFFTEFVDTTAENTQLNTLWQTFTDDTRFFIFDTKGAVDGNNYADQDFEKYQWRARSFNRVRKGDWFIYRRPQNGNRQFYLFGAGQVGDIEEGHDSLRTATLVNTFAFPHYLLGDDDELLNYKWDVKERTRKDWQHFFNQYGMTSSTQTDFINLVTMGMQTESLPISMDLVKEESAIYQSIRHGNYTITDRTSKTKQRVGQQVIAEIVKENYAYHCAVTGVKTREFLVASHIIPWAKSTERRLDPTNVICLSTLWDRAFDQGFVTFDAHDLRVRTSPKLAKDPELANMFKKYDRQTITLPAKDRPSTEALEYHNDLVFKG